LDGRLGEVRVQTDGSKRQTDFTSREASITYDPATGTYTFREVDGTSFTITPNELVAGESNAIYSVYVDAGSGVKFKLLNGGSTNSLIALDHVRYGKWSHGVSPTTGFSSASKTDWMLFGDRTALASIPRSGTATFSGIIDGDYHDNAGDYVLSGAAGLTANFTSSTLAMFINPTATNKTTGNVLTFGARSGSGAIDYTLGQFSGTDSSDAYGFSYIGNFYGPAAQEVGGTFQLTNGVGTSNIGSGQGVFVGKIGDLPTPAAEPVPPAPPAQPTRTSLGITTVSEVKADQAGVSRTTMVSANNITYDAASQSYVLRDAGGVSPTVDDGVFNLAADEIVAGESDAAFTTYQDSATGLKFRTLNLGAGNPLIALSYVSYGSWSRSVKPRDGYVQATTTVYAVYGDFTDPLKMPRTGTATYSGILDGTFTRANREADVYGLSGSASFRADFGTGRMGVVLNPIGTRGSSTINFGSISLTGTINGANFSAWNNYTSPYMTNVNGAFFGPAAEEVGAAFSITGLTGRAPTPGSGTGVIVGKKD
jgi:hypothetical protein